MSQEAIKKFNFFHHLALIIAGIFVTLTAYDLSKNHFLGASFIAAYLAGLIPNYGENVFVSLKTKKKTVNKIVTSYLCIAITLLILASLDIIKL